MKFTILFWYFCSKRNCGIDEQETLSESFDCKSLDEAKKYAYSRFLTTRSCEDAWHFCHRVRLIEADNLATPVYDWFWKEKDKIVVDYSNFMLRFERLPIRRQSYIK